MNIISALLMAVALSAGNAELEKTSANGAFEIAFGRERSRIVEAGLPPGMLSQLMLSNCAECASRAAAKSFTASYGIDYIEAELTAAATNLAFKLSIGQPSSVASFSEAEERRFREVFEQNFDSARRQACEEQSRTIAWKVRPEEAEFERGSDDELASRMRAKVLEERKQPVFEENLQFVDERIVAPVIADARREMKRQKEYLTRAKCEAIVPSRMETELAAKLRENVEKLHAKAKSAAFAWGVFPETLRKTLPIAVEHRVMDRMAKIIGEVELDINEDVIASMISENPGEHRTLAKSTEWFRATIYAQLREKSLEIAVRGIPAADAEELSAYLKERLDSPALAKAMDFRFRRYVLPFVELVRGKFAEAEFERLWPTLANRTWFPQSEFADEIAARSDYAREILRWRHWEGENAIASTGGEVALEETDKKADAQVAQAMELSRSAIAAQNALVTRLEPNILTEACRRRDSFFSFTPDHDKIVELLTEAVEEGWRQSRLNTLWPEGELPENASEQHVELFPSVRKRIEMSARTIENEMRKEDSTEGEGDETEQWEVVVSRESGGYSVEVKGSGRSVFSKKVPASREKFREAMKEAGDKMATEVLGL